MKKLIPAIVLLLISAMVMSTASYAWFTMNRTVEATGMSIKAQSSSSLVISTSAISSSTTDNTVAFTSGASTLIPCTHDDRDDDGNAYPNLLKYNTNPTDVSLTSGFASDSANAPLTFAAAANSGSTLYYVDYQVYIASAGSALVNQTLNASIATTVDLENATTLKAASVDFYLGSVSATNFKGTLNLAGVNPATTDGTGAQATVNLLNGVTTPTIPSSSNNQSIIVIMRVYFDGALRMNQNTAYVNTSTIQVDELPINVSFVAADIQ